MTAFQIINDTISHNTGYNASDYVYGKPVIAQDIKADEGVQVKLHVFSTLTLSESEWSASYSGRLSWGKKPRCLPKRTLCGPQCRSGLLKEQEISHPCWESSFDSSVVQLIISSDRDGVCSTGSINSRF